MARFALGRIDAPQAGAALHEALGRTSGKTKAGIINTLVQMEYAEATDNILALTADPERDVADPGTGPLYPDPGVYGIYPYPSEHDETDPPLRDEERFY